MMGAYQAPWYLKDGLWQTTATSYWYGTAWSWWGDRVPWLAGYPLIPWQEHVFEGADGVPLWGQWASPPKARGTLIINYGITGQTTTAWYAQTLARKAYARSWAVCLYDWRGHGQTGERSPAPSSDGWREGEDQVRMAEQLVALGCPERVSLAGFSLGGQLALWGLKAAVELGTPFIQSAAVLAPNLESNRSLAYLRTTPGGRAIEWMLVQEIRREAQKRRERFPEAVKPGAVERITSISSYDHEMVIDYYGFLSVADYYQKTSGLYLLDTLALPYLLIYAEDDPMFDPALLPEIRERTARNPQAQLLMTQGGGHVGHITQAAGKEDEFWGLNRMLDFLGNLI
ncbi:YheT family hydrolase [Anthocerotibacter panamensis]|uniref:YheT family hydrolase n=1 Tax=Anthocerotibacter panamensis TaxID=2857077 RepID=UPI001FD895BA|nr:alpha/beta fold hydrolase [Anthocerotibacter panamensis]